MKSWLNKYFILFMTSLALMSCEKDEEKLIITEGTAPVLSASANSLVLNKDNTEAPAVTLSWAEADFGFPAAVTYTIQVDTAENNFATPAEIGVGSSTEQAYTVGELNTLLTKLKYEADVAHSIKIRIKAAVSNKVESVYSAPVTLNITPYSTFVEPGYIYVPGDYQGWSPETAPSLISVQNDGIYKGIISFLGTNNRKFKFTEKRDWSKNYGTGATAGTLVENAGDLEIPTNDSYELTVNLNTLTWSHKKYSWGLIGDATPGGWDNDTNLKYINEEGVWKATIELKVGNIKFRLNDAWDTNYGDDDTANSLLNQGGKDIPITVAGTYEVVLDLENEDGSVTYTLTKK